MHDREVIKKTGLPSLLFPKVFCKIFATILALAVILNLGDVQAAENANTSGPPKSPPVASAGYELQLNSFKVKSNATRFFDGLVKKGYKPYMVFVQNGETWHKVRLGPYPSKETAEQIAVDIKQKYGLPSLVLLGEKFQSNSKKVSKSSPRRVAPENAGNSIDVVMSQFLMWLKAWQGKQLDSYFSFYSRSFESGGKPFKDWQKEQSESLDEIKHIKVEVNDLELLENGDTIEMSFIESFQSKSFSNIRRKVLVWKKEKGVWRIIVESSEPA